jgi:hypothetical protein
MNTMLDDRAVPVPDRPPRFRSQSCEYDSRSQSSEYDSRGLCGSSASQLPLDFSEGFTWICLRVWVFAGKPLELAL